MGVKPRRLLTEPRWLRSGTQVLPGLRTDYEPHRRNLAFPQPGRRTDI